MSSPTTAQITKHSRPGGTLIVVSGPLDESFNPAAVVESAQGVVVFDLDQVNRISSFGVGRWVQALRGLPDSYYCFVRCRPAIVAQFNMISGFAGRGQLLSFYAPYVCTRCSTPAELLIDVRAQYQDLCALRLPDHPCAHCSAPTELDDLEETYLAYVAGAVEPTPPPTVDQILRPQPPASRFRVEVEVENGVTAIWLRGHLEHKAALRRLSLELQGQVVVLLQHLEDATPDGLAALQQMLQSPTGTLWVARAQPALTAAFAKEPGLLGRATLISDASDASSPSASDGAAEVRAYLSANPTSKSEAQTVLLTRKWDENDPQARLFGRYELIKRLGVGGMAEVFLARQTGSAGFEKKIVLKRILPEHSQDPKFATLFFEEAKLAARISHPNVVQIYDLGQVGARYFIAMEYVPGSDLQRLLSLANQLGLPPPVPVVCKIFIDACSGLEAAHTCRDDDGRPLGVIHRDVSPHNLLVSRGGQVKVADFGIATPAIDSRDSDQGLRGKVSYLAPERLRGAPTDHRSDIFALGVSLHEALVLQPLFRRGTDKETIQAILFDAVPSPTALNRTVPEALSAVVLKALSRDVQKRYASAYAMQQELEQIMRTFPNPAGTGELAEWLRLLSSRAENTEDPAVRGLLLTPSATTLGAKRDESKEEVTPVVNVQRLPRS